MNFSIVLKIQKKSAKHIQIREESDILETKVKRGPLSKFRLILGDIYAQKNSIN